MKKSFPILLVLILAFSGCGSLENSLRSSYNMVKCEYSYNSISRLSVAGMNLSEGLNPMSILKLTSLFSGNLSSLPMDFTVNLNVKNPNQSAAALNGMQYIVNIDGVEFTNGRINQSLNISPGQTQMLPITIGVDLVNLMQGGSKDAIVNIAKNFLGMGSEKSNVSIQLKPSFMIGNQVVSSPIYIPVNFAFGGKNQ